MLWISFNLFFISPQILQTQYYLLEVNRNLKLEKGSLLFSLNQMAITSFLADKTLATLIYLCQTFLHTWTNGPSTCFRSTSRLKSSKWVLLPATKPLLQLYREYLISLLPILVFFRTSVYISTKLQRIFHLVLKSEKWWSA